MVSVSLVVVLFFGAGVTGDFLPIAGRLATQLERAVTGLLDLPLEYNVEDGAEFEYVVVGGGAGGCAVAARLALAGRSVLLLEAGNRPTPLTWVPGAAMALLGSGEDWQYRTLSNNVSCLSSEEQQCRFSRGRALGGSTALNYMMYVRGNRADYHYDLPGWTWEEFEPFFLRYEGLRDLAELPASSAPYHNTNGTVHVGFTPDPENRWHRRIVEGLETLGFPFNADVNAESQIGVSRVVTYTTEGRRESAASAYLSRADVRSSLRVSTGSRVTRVHLDERLVARAVTVQRAGGDRITVRASRAIVLSAGTIATPQILMLSGVGPTPHLEKFGIPPRIDLPVGENMSDHVLPLIFIEVDGEPWEPADLGAAAARYGLARDGPLASIGLTDVTAFANTRCYDARSRRLRARGPGGEDCELPTLQLINAYIQRGAVTAGEPLFKQSTQLSDAVIAQLVGVSARRALLVASLVVLRPASRGWVRLASGDPLRPPAVFPNYLADERDVREMLRAVTVLEHLVETPPFRARGAAIVRLSLPGCPQYARDRAGYWACYVRHLTFSVFHATGTCALGGVLDARLGVRGARALHVADLSALPRVPRGNTAAAAIALGERLAHFLLENEASPNNLSSSVRQRSHRRNPTFPFLSFRRRLEHFQNNRRSLQRRLTAG